ncbi:MAG: hypothetical protein JWO51_1355 [Rhodospirillales bacterium]|nr:hypothetical protein [Rhodospirillales bacterium]
MTRSSPETRELAEHFATIRDAGESMRASGPTPMAVGTLFAAALVATDLQRDPASSNDNDNDLHRRAAYREFRRHAIAQLLPCLEDELLAALSLRDSIDETSAPGLATPNDLARCLMALGRLIEQPRGSARVGLELVRRVEAHSRRIRDRLDATELVDLPLLAANQRQIGAMLDVLELLGDEIGDKQVRQHSRILARAALRRVTATMESCLVDAALRARFDLLATADDFLVMTRRVIEGVGEEYDPAAEHYAEDLGMDALRRFAAAMLAIEHKTLGDCLAAVERPAMATEEFGARLRMLVQMHGLGRAIQDGCAVRSVAEGAARAVERAEQLLRPREIVEAIEAMAQEMDRLLSQRGPSARLEAYATLFDGFKAQTGLPPV